MLSASATQESCLERLFLQPQVQARLPSSDGGGPRRSAGFASATR